MVDKSLDDFFSAWISDSYEDQLLVAEEGALYEVAEKLHLALDEAGMSRKEFAAKIGKSPGYITRVLKGNHNLTIKSLAALLFALNKEFTLSLAPVGDESDNYWEHMGLASNIYVMGKHDKHQRRKLIEKTRIVDQAANDEYEFSTLGSIGVSFA